MTNAVKQISTVAALKSWLVQLESQRVSEFVFLPKGALAARCPGGDPSALVMDLTSLVCRVESTMTTQGGQLIRVTCRLTYHACVRMLDAWRTRQYAGLNREELQALPLAEGIVKQIAQRRKMPMDRLYMLYSYLGASIEYRAGHAHTSEFPQLVSAAWALLRKVANCQGFAGMMYLCGGMMGFRMGLQSGESTAGGHMWNTIELGAYHYALDCSAAAVARAQSRRMLADYASFLMGKREAAENGLTWSAEKESLRLSPRLAPENDYYHATGASFSTAEAAARFVWKKRLAGEKLTHLRIRGTHPITMKDLSSAIHAVGEEPAMNRAIFANTDGRVSYSIIGNDNPLALYVSIEWS